MTGGPTSASTGSPLGRRSFIPGTPRFVRFISLLCDAPQGAPGFSWTPQLLARDAPSAEEARGMKGRQEATRSTGCQQPPHQDFDPFPPRKYLTAIARSMVRPTTAGRRAASAGVRWPVRGIQTRSSGPPATALAMMATAPDASASVRTTSAIFTLVGSLLCGADDEGAAAFRLRLESLLPLPTSPPLTCCTALATASHNTAITSDIETQHEGRAHLS
jgi:hypothetical protein